MSNGTVYTNKEKLLEAIRDRVYPNKDFKVSARGIQLNELDIVESLWNRGGNIPTLQEVLDAGESAFSEISIQGNPTNGGYLKISESGGNAAELGFNTGIGQGAGVLVDGNLNARLVSNASTQGSGVNLTPGTANMNVGNPNQSTSVNLDATSITLSKSDLGNNSSIVIDANGITLNIQAGFTLFISNLSQQNNTSKVLVWDQGTGTVQYQDGVVAPLPPADDGNTYKLIKNDSGMSWVLDT